MLEQLSDHAPVVQDRRRVLEIDRYQVLLDPPRSDLVALVDIAAQVAGVPLATINLITDVAQHQIATKGFDASVCAREDSMCNVVLHEGAPVVVPDASQDPRFADNPFVTGEIGDVRFYATHQLVTPHGVVVGTLCVFDTVAREITDDQERALAELAERVVDLLELELRTRELASSVSELERVRDELVKLVMGPYPRRGLTLLVDTGLAELVLPELPALALERDEHHLARLAMRHHYFDDLQVGDSTRHFLDSVSDLVHLRDRLVGEVAGDEQGVDTIA